MGSEVKVAICGVIGSENLGDRIISKSIAWLVNDVMQELYPGAELQFTEVDLEGRFSDLKPYSGFIDNRKKNYYKYNLLGAPSEFVYIALKKLMRRAPSQKQKNRLNGLRHFIWNHSLNLRGRLYKFYNEKISDADFIIVAGGGILEYSRNEYQEPLKVLCDFAEEHKIPVVFNAIGRAGEFEPEDLRCKILMSIFKNPAVRYVSARDSVENVQQCVGERCRVKLCADAAFWMDRAFGAERRRESSVIGIGLIRGDSLKSYNRDFSENDWIELFAGIAAELAGRKRDFRFFTNGLVSDYELGKKVIARTGLPDSYLIDRPTDVNELVDTISSFEGLITCRMHSSIAAFALGIPSVILSWNDKVNKYMDIAGYHERAVDMENFDPRYIVDAYERAVAEGVADSRRNKMKQMARESVLDYSGYVLNTK